MEKEKEKDNPKYPPLFKKFIGHMYKFNNKNKDTISDSQYLYDSILFI